MIIMANWWETALKTGMGDTFADIATAPIPVGPSGDKSSSSISYSWMTVVNAAADDAEQAAAWDFLQWLNGPDSGENGSSAMGDILMSMGILPSRSSDVDAHGDKLADPFLEGYVSQLESATPFPIVLGGQEFTEALQAQIEALGLRPDRRRRCVADRPVRRRVDPVGGAGLTTPAAHPPTPR